MQLAEKIITHEKFVEAAQYWCPESEKYAAASHLISALRNGWSLALPRARARQIWNSGSRSRTLYDFTLVRGSQLMIMPVLSNPFIERFLAQNDIRVITDLPTEPLLMPEPVG